MDATTPLQSHKLLNLSCAHHSWILSDYVSLFYAVSPVSVRRRPSRRCTEAGASLRVESKTNLFDLAHHLAISFLLPLA